MLVTIPLDLQDAKPAVSELLARGREPSEKLFVLKATAAPGDILALYDPLIPELGTVCAFAEDVALGDRNKQRAGPAQRCTGIRQLELLLRRSRRPGEHPESAREISSLPVRVGWRPGENHRR